MSSDKGMTYIEKVAHGNAGEFYFAYWISCNFIWPCRILDIDMGLDAQIEIYDDNYHSTGMFIGAQVKTTANTFEESPSVSVPRKNIVYWESISDPIVIIRVCLNENSQYPDLYWKHLNKKELKNLNENAITKDNETVSITFTDDNLLKKSDKTLWLEMFLSDEDKDIIEHAEGIKKEIDDYGKYFEDNFENGQFINGFPGLRFTSDLNNLLNEYDKLATAVKVNPRLEYLSNDVKSTITSYNSHIETILLFFQDACNSNSIYEADFDSFSPINPLLHKIFNKY
ncbi:uncharacterized protein DUF4365 [Enterobacter sp. AG5470]|nr:uncharacterized protein DUF4365 [Enterobacter sp. AG5470]